MNAKDPQLRFNIIDLCLSSTLQEYWSGDELQKEYEKWDVDVSLRTLKQDISDMRKTMPPEVEIKYVPNNGYHYSVRGFSMNGLPAHELMALMFVYNLNEHLDCGDVMKKAKGTIKKLTKKNVLFKAGMKLKQNVISMEPRPYYKGVTNLSPILEAIYNDKVLEIEYQKFTDTVGSKHVFHPYQLKTYLGRWYVRGYSEKHKDDIVLGLDRIQEIKEVKKGYRKDTAGDYFLHIVGITKTKGPIEEVRLSFTPAQGYYVKTLYLHHSQQIVKDDKEELVITLRIILNYDFCLALMGHMPNVTVLAPLSLKEQFVAMLQEGLKRNLG